MKFLVTMEAFHSISGPDAVRQLRKEVGAQIRRITESGKMEAGGICVGKRGGFFVLNADSEYELMELLGSALPDNFNLTVNPVISFEEMGKFFEEHPPGE